MTLPILVNHDHSRPPIGVVDVQGGRLAFSFAKPVELEQVFEIFGNVGVQLTVMQYAGDGTCLVSAGIIFEFSTP